MKLLASLLICICGSIFVTGTTDSGDQAAVVNFYNGLTNTGTWIFNTALDICDNYSGWVLCSGSHIIWLDLHGFELAGTIATDLGDIATLRKLDLSYNYLTGSIPSELSTLSQLPTISLQSNNLTGSIPSWLASMTWLQDIHLDHNQLAGTIPSNLGVLNLIAFEVHYNLLTGTIPAIFAPMPGLRSLKLGGYGDGNLYCPRADYSTWASGSGSTTDYTDGTSVSTCTTCGSLCAAGTYCSSVTPAAVNCPIVYCPADHTSGFADWTATATGSSPILVTGTCQSGYDGAPNRTCTQSGPTGVWGSVSEPCTTTIVINIQTLPGTDMTHNVPTHIIFSTASHPDVNVLLTSNAIAGYATLTKHFSVAGDLTAIELGRSSTLYALKVAYATVTILSNTFNSTNGGITGGPGYGGVNMILNLVQI